MFEHSFQYLGSLRKKLIIRNKKELFNQQLKGVDNPINSKFVFFNLILNLCKMVKGGIGQFLYFIFFWRLPFSLWRNSYFLLFAAQVQETQEESSQPQVSADEATSELPDRDGEAGQSQVRVLVWRPGQLLLPHQQHVRPALPPPRVILILHQHTEGSVDWVSRGRFRSL